MNAESEKKEHDDAKATTSRMKANRQEKNHMLKKFKKVNEKQKKGRRARRRVRRSKASGIKKKGR